MAIGVKSELTSLSSTQVAKVFTDHNMASEECKVVTCEYCSLKECNCYTEKNLFFKVTENKVKKSSTCIYDVHVFYIVRKKGQKNPLSSNQRIKVMNI